MEPVRVTRASSKNDSIMKTRFTLLALGVTLLMLHSPASGQLGGGQPGLNAAMLQLFKDVPYFSSKADVRLDEKGEKIPTTMTMNFSMLNGNVRVELDMNAVRSKQMTPDGLLGLKQAGLDKLVTIVRPERKTATLVYPSVQSFVEMPMTKEEAADLMRPYRASKVLLGKETIDGQPCEKTRVTLTADSGAKQEATVWYATGLKGFPIKVEMLQPDATLTMHYRDVKLAKPDASQFEAPAKYTRYSDIEQLMQAAGTRALTGKKP